MKKLLICACALVLLTSSIWATDTRVMVMGENNMILLDEANISLFPSRINDYPNIAVGEFGGNSFTNFGVNWQFGPSDKPWVLGTYFSTMPVRLPHNYMGGSLVDWDALGDQMVNRLAMTYGRGMGEYNIGLGIDLSSASYDLETTDVNSKVFTREESFRLLSFNFGLTPTTGSWDAAVHISFGSMTDIDTDSVGWADERIIDQTEGDGYSDFGISARYFYRYSPTYTFVPHVSIEMGKHGTSWNTDTAAGLPVLTKQKFERTEFDLGVGMNYEPATNVLAVFDFGVNLSKVTDKYTRPVFTGPGYEVAATKNENKITAMPYFKLGLDADIFKWLDLRAGVTSFWNRTKATTEFFPAGGSETKRGMASNSTYLGFGFHWGRLHVDTYTDPELFLDGFNFISGRDNNMNFQISALYEMM